MNFKRLMSLLLCLLMLVTFVLPLAACKDPDDPTPPPAECTEHTDENNDNLCDKCGETIDVIPDGQNMTYTVKVTSEGGMPFPNIYVMVLEGESTMKGMLETNDDGIAKFELPKSNNYSIQIVPGGIPDGYKVEERYEMGATGANIRLRSSVITDGKMPSSYKLGDVIHDFTITDVKGKSYKLSDILGIGEGKKQMVMLNFWFSTCSPCISEFPHINDNAVSFSDDAIVFAVNDNNGDDVSDYSGLNVEERVQSFASTAYFESDPLTFPLFKYDGASKDKPVVSMFNSANTYPTTVIIDRYGVICFMNAGSITSESAWYKMFSHFTADNYEQQLITDYSQLNPPVVPTTKWEGSDTVADAFIKDGNEVTVTFSPETDQDADYAWHFNTATYGEGENAVSCIKPMNINVENSFAIMHADVSLKPGQAIAFDYLASTQYGYDNLYVIVEGKDICTITGCDDDPQWKECCAYVDPRPIITGENGNENDVETYRISFVYQKDDSVNTGDDTVYMRDFRVIGVDEIAAESYIFRYAATEISKRGDGFENYVTIVLNNDDGYYHVDTADGPLLLVNHLGYTLFDPENFISNRLYENGNSLKIDDVEMYNTWLTYGNCSANSDLYGFTPVTEELKNILVGYTKKYATDLGFEFNENLWLSLCVYYDAYGRDEDGNPTKHLADPIKGLATFSAFEVEFTPDNAGDSTSCEVTYNKVIMPRGLLYKFVPTVSGVYRVNSKSNKEVVGWIFVGTSHEWMSNQNERTILADFETEERFCPYLYIKDDEAGTLTYDNNNVSLVAYMEAGKSYYIDIAYYDMYKYGTFEFDIMYEGATKNDYFIQASPGPLTYIESSNGGISQPIAIGIDYAVDPSDGYVHHVIERDDEGNVTKWGSIIYADFSLPTTYFTSQSIVELNKINAFNFAIDELDREALVLLETIKIYGRNAIINKWIAEDTSDASDADKKKNATAKWYDGGYDDILDDLIFKPSENGTYDEVKLATAEEAKKIGTAGLMRDWAVDNDALGISTIVWENLNIESVVLDPTANGHSAEQLAIYDKAKAEYEAQWAAYRMDDVANGIYHATGAFTDRDIKALEYKAVYDDGGKAALEALWNEEFSYLTTVPSGYDSKYDYLWEFYAMQDVMADGFNGHGEIDDYTAVIDKYIALMTSDDVYERQGCVAVTEELMNILDIAVGKYVFDNALHGWLKFCFYYNYLGE